MDIVTSTIFSPGAAPGAVFRDQMLDLPRLGLLAIGDALVPGEEGRAGIRIALASVRASIERQQDMLERFHRHPTAELRDQILGIVQDAIGRAAQEVFAYARRFEGLRITVDVVLLLTHEAFVGHVGDGRVYLVRRGLVHQLTVDHTTAEDTVFGEPEPPGEPAEPTPCEDRQVFRVLGPEPTVRVESLCMELVENDRFVLCTYALHQCLPEGVLHHHLLADPLDTLGPGLIAATPEVPLVAVAGQMGGTEPDILDSGRSRLAILAPIPLFAHCTERELRAIAGATHPRRFEPGTVLFEQGDPGTELYLVISGRIRIDRDGKAIVTLGPGHNFGEMALLDQPLRSATAVAEEECEVMVISREAFFALLNSNPVLAVKILWNLTLRLSANLRATSAALARAHGGVPLEATMPSVASETTAATVSEDEDGEIVLTAPLVSLPPPRTPAAAPEREEASTRAESEASDQEDEDLALPEDPDEDDEAKE